MHCNLNYLPHILNTLHGPFDINRKRMGEKAASMGSIDQMHGEPNKKQKRRIKLN